jgi:hypothetical protein
MKRAFKQRPTKPNGNLHPGNHLNSGLFSCCQPRLNSLEGIMIRDGNCFESQRFGPGHQLSGGKITIRGLGVVMQVGKYQVRHVFFS